MDLIKDIVYEKRYTNDIKSNKYIQHSIKPNMDEKMTISKTNKFSTRPILCTGCPPQQEFVWWNLPVTVSKRTPW
jgi:hypothetical protein